MGGMMQPMMGSPMMGGGMNMGGMGMQGNPYAPVNTPLPWNAPQGQMGMMGNQPQNPYLQAVSGVGVNRGLGLV
ncbi:hypothetical protein D3C78_1573520 [compost metagenome]